MQIVKKTAALNEGWTEKLTMKGGRYIVLNGIAYILAGFSAYGMNPVGMAYFMGLSMSGYGNIITVLIMLAGMTQCFAYLAVAKYAAMMLSILAITRLVQFSKIKLSVYTYGILCMVNVLLLELTGIYLDNPAWSRDAVTVIKQLSRPVAAAVLAAAFVVIFEKGINIISRSNKIIASEDLFSLAVIGGCMLYAAGTNFHLPAAIIEIFMYFMLAFGAYKYGAGIGAIFGAACGIPLCLWQGDIGLLGIMCLAGICAGIFRELGRFISILTFGCTIVTAGYVVMPYFISETSIKGLLGTLVIFLTLPENLVYRFEENREDSMQRKMDSLFEEKLLSVAKAFDKLSVSISELSKKNEPVREEEICMNQVWRTKLEESRQAMSKQLEQISQIIQEYSREMYNFIRITNEEEEYIRHKLKGKKVNMTKIMGIENRRHKCEYLVTARCDRGTTVGTREVAKIISEAMGKNYMPAKNCRKVLSHEFTTTTYVEEANFYVLHGAAGLARGNGGISGDNYSFQELDNGQMIMSLSDGMGYGASACIESETVIELLEQLLDSGFSEEAALKMINSVMIMNSEEEHPATLDFGIIDLHSGVCDLVKIGAAATFVKRGKWIETIKSTSMPLGVFGEVDYDTTTKKLYDGDMVIMVSDGVLDALDCDNKAEKLSEIIMGINSSNPKEVARKILEQAAGTEENTVEGSDGLSDDMTVLVTGIWNRKTA